MDALKFRNEEGRKSFATEYPFKQNSFDRGDGIKLNYVDEGSGEPMLMVHGNPTWSYYYRNLVKTFSDRFRCVAIDHIGCGFSDVPSEDKYDYTLGSRVDDLAKLADHLGLTENITLVVHDWGGMIGMAFADRYPERIKRIVILNTAAFPLPKSKSFPWQLWLTRTWLGEILVMKGNAFSRAAAQVSCTRKKLSSGIKQGYAAPYENPDRRIATLRFVQDIPLRPEDRAYEIVAGVASRLDQFKDTPALICWGLKDFVFDKHFLAEWESHWPHAEVHRFADCGHYILEDAFEDIVPLMNDFIAKND